MIHLIRQWWRFRRVRKYPVLPHGEKAWVIGAIASIRKVTP